MSAAAPVILAIASPPGRSLRGIIRISGDQAFSLLYDLLKPPIGGEGGAGFHFEPGLHSARLQLDRLSVAVMALIFAGPRSYTGEHAVELQLPGNPLLLERVLDAVLREANVRHIDARRAEPGEFTARAYLNGRISLTQAEGVAATIAAQSDAQLRAAHLLLGGRLGGLAHEVADELAACLALVEAGIDFTDQEDVVAISPGDLHGRLTMLCDRIDQHLSRAVGSERLEAIPWVLLRGRPNAGKSALFNALLGHERAVVSPVAGTTRDVIAEPLQIDTPHGPAEVMLIDLAGQDDLDPSEINRLMQATARAAAQRAELILQCIPFSEESGSAWAEGDGRPIIVRTKADLALQNTPVHPSEIAVSALTGRGLPDLRARIGGHLAGRAVSLAADALVLTPRHDAAMRAARDHLAEAISLVAPFGASRHAPNPELIAAAMRASLNALAELAGDITPDDVLGRVFSSFCVGK